MSGRIYRQRKLTVLSRKKIEYIAHNYEFSKHSFNRLRQRCGNFDVRKMILNALFAYVNTDGYINIAVDLNHFFIVKELKNNKYKIITFQEKSMNGYTTVDKFVFAYLGIDRHSKI